MNLLIINKSDFEGRIDISANMNDAKRLNQHILHAQDFDLRKLMGDKFYYYFIGQFQYITGRVILKDTASDQIKDFYNGSSYAVDEIEWINPGVKPILVYFAGARLVKGIEDHITPTGFRSKINDFSEPVSSSRKLFIANEYENQASSYWSMVETFMAKDKTLFPQYFDNSCGCSINQKNKPRPKSIAIGNTNNYFDNGEFYNRRR